SPPTLRRRKASKDRGNRASSPAAGRDLGSSKGSRALSLARRRTAKAAPMASSRVKAPPPRRARSRANRELRGRVILVQKVRRVANVPRTRGARRNRHRALRAARRRESTAGRPVQRASHLRPGQSLLRAESLDPSRGANLLLATSKASNPPMETRI